MFVHKGFVNQKKMCWKKIRFFTFSRRFKTENWEREEQRTTALEGHGPLLSGFLSEGGEAAVSSSKVQRGHLPGLASYLVCVTATQLCGRGTRADSASPPMPASTHQAYPSFEALSPALLCLGCSCSGWGFLGLSGGIVLRRGAS